VCVSADGPRPNQNDIVDLRFLMLEYVRQLVLRGSGVQDDELQSIMNFLTTIHEVCVCAFIFIRRSVTINRPPPAHPKRLGLADTRTLLVSRMWTVKHFGLDLSFLGTII